MKKDWKRSMKCFVVALMTSTSCLLGAMSAQAQDEIPWKADEIFQSTIYEEDVVTILKRIIRINGQQHIIKQGVEGVVRNEEFNQPLKGAFDQLIEEHELEYSYDSQANTVTIGPKQTREADIGDLIMPQFLSLQDLKGILARFGIMRGGRFVESDLKTVIFDEQTRSIYVKGRSSKVTQIKTLIRELDIAAKKRHQRDLARRKADRDDTLANAEVLSKTAEFGVKQEVSEAIRNITMKVIPLRYASVGTTTMTFMDSKITVPGLDETLKSLLGGSAIAGKKASDVDSAFGDLAKPIISVDARTNSLIVRGTEKAIKEIEDIVRRIDKEVKMVDIEVMIVSANVGTSKELGVQWATARAQDKYGRNLSGGLSTGAPSGANVKSLADFEIGTNSPAKDALDLGTSTASQKNFFDPISLLPLNPAQGILGSIIFHDAREFLEARLNLLENDGTAQTVASPHVVTLDNTAAKITSSSTHSIPVSGTGAGATGDLKEINAGLSIDITPTIVDTGDQPLLRLNINARNSAFTTNLNTTQDEVQTNILVPNNATFMMGGLFTTKRQERENGVPGLKDIPFLGALFRSQNSDDERSETIFFITPRVVAQNDLAVQSGSGVKTFLDSQQRIMHKDRLKIQKTSHLLDMTE